MCIEIINTGSELLLGSTLNTHGAWLGQELVALGLRVQRQLTVPDGDAIRDALRESVQRSDAVIVTGGLGPTSDDLSREATGEALGIELIEDEHAVRCIKAYFDERGIEMAPSNLKQALNPCGADILPNPNGTAPGVYVPPRLGKEACAVFLLPGPPHEMHAMYHAEVEPRLRALTDISDDHGISMLKLVGVGESRFQDTLDAQLNAIEDVEIGYCARPGEMDLRAIGAAKGREQAINLAKQTFPECVVSDDERSLEEVLIHTLTEQGKTIATAESCTGGNIASRLTDVSGASAVFTHGFVTYSNEAKTQLLGVPTDLLEAHGAVSEEVASAMAAGAMQNAQADIGIAVTGIAGPTGGSEEKPVGTVWIGISVKGKPPYAFKKFYPNGRAVFKQLVSQTAMMRALQIMTAE